MTAPPKIVALAQERFRKKAAEQSAALLHHASDGIHILDYDGKIIEVSDSFCAMLGYERAEMIGMHVSRWDAHFASEDLMRVVHAQHESKGRVQFETQHRRKDGTIIDVEVSGLPLNLDGQSVLFNSSRDIGERKRIESALQQQLNFSRSLNEIARCLVEHEDSTQILSNAMRIVGEMLGADRALIYDISYEKDQAIGMCQWLNPRHPEISSTKASYPLSTFSGGTNEIRRSRTHLTSHRDEVNPHLIADGSGETLHAKMMIWSLLWYPIAFRDNGYYLLVLNQTQARKDWAREELDYLQSVSNLVSIALDKIRVLAQRTAALNELRVAATAFEAQEGVLITDAQARIVRVNRAFTRITGYTPQEVIGKSPRVLSSGRHDAAFYQSMWENLRRQQSWEGEIWNRRKNGEAYPQHLSITAVRDAEGEIRNYVGTFSDITLRKSAEEEIRSLAFYDPLTQLPNRRNLLEQLRQALAANAHTGHLGALLFLDLDNFKSLNDTLGHEKGDLLLQQVAQRLNTCVREGDTVARLGGDEFVVLLVELSTHTNEAMQQVAAVGQKILAALNEPFLLAGHESHSSASIGVTLFSKMNSAIGDLLKQADIAMYQAKRGGRNTIRFFDPPMQDRINSLAVLEEELRKAIEEHQFRLHYQIQVDSSGHVFGAEALVRWQRPGAGLVPPGRFIPLAEETGLILPIGRWILDTACAQLKSWEADPRTCGLFLCVNVSAKQFRQPDFVDQVRSILRAHDINPERLKLELTETMLLGNIEDAIATMHALRQTGVRFSLDDFGTGYSSLQYLKRLPLTQLKIDQSFVRDIATDANDRAIVSTIVAMAQTLNMDVIAEGVETEEQRQCLLRAGCVHYQGFLFGPPVPIERFCAAVAPIR